MITGDFVLILKLNFGYTYSKLIEASKSGGIVELVPESEFFSRISICDGCSYRLENQCLDCGCNIYTKASVKKDPFTRELVNCKKWKV